MKIITSFFIPLLLSISVLAAEPLTASGVSTDEATFAEIFNSNLRLSDERIREDRTPYEMEFAYSMGKLGDSRLENDYYQIDLSGQSSNLSMVRFYAASEVFTAGGFFVSPGLGMGYAFQESVVTAYAKKGGEYRDLVRLQWAPLQLGTKIGYRFSRLKSSVFARTALTSDWVSVTGNLDGINQSYWTTGYLWGAGLTLFESDNRDLKSWFGGVTVSTGASKPLSENDRGLQSTWSEIGMRFLL